MGEQACLGVVSSTSSSSSLGSQDLIGITTLKRNYTRLVLKVLILKVYLYFLRLTRNARNVNLKFFVNSNIAAPFTRSPVI